MQSQDASAELMFKLWPWLEANRNRLIGGLVAIVAISGVWYFFSAQKTQKEIDAGQAYTALVMNPAYANNSAQMATQLEQLADKYSGTPAALRAQLQAASALFDAGNYAEAQTRFQKFLDSNSSGILAATAALGLAASLEAQNKGDQAAAAYQRVTTAFGDTVCAAPAEFALGRLAEQQKKFTEALAHYEKVAKSGNRGSLVSEAMVRASDIRAQMPAAAPKAEATTLPATAPAAAVPAKPATKP